MELVQLHGDDFTVVGVNTDTNADEFKSKCVTSNVTWKSAWKSTIPAKWGVRSFPTMFLLDHEGRISAVGHHLDLKQLVPALIAERDAAQADGGAN